KACPFWATSSHCGLRDCAVKPCSPFLHIRVCVCVCVCVCVQYSAASNEPQQPDCEQEDQLGAVNVSLSNETREALLNWNRHDDEAERFCVVDDEESPDSQYVDLLLNPERFTGYRGAEAWQIWNSIYEENCFNTEFTDYQPRFSQSLSGRSAKIFHSWLEGQCVEKRAFYRLISGLHASINIHLSARYLLDGETRPHTPPLARSVF
ncbi:unnamed protein product, partial [Tetraodon nigroviridis]